MFEKDAEERITEQFGTSGEYVTRQRIWQEGAEFGYNKANEWLYPSKGELPKCDEKTQLIFCVNCYYEIGGKTITRKRTVLGYYKNSFLNDDIKLFVEKVKVMKMNTYLKMLSLGKKLYHLRRVNRNVLSSLLFCI